MGITGSAGDEAPRLLDLLVARLDTAAVISLFRSDGGGLLRARVGLTYPNDPAEVLAWVSNGQWISAGTTTCQKPLLHLYCLEI